MSYASAEINHSVSQASEDRTKFHSQQSDEAEFYPSFPHELTEQIVARLGESSIVVTHFNDAGGRVASEIYAFGSSENVEQVVKTIADVASPTNRSRENMSESVRGLRKYVRVSSPSAFAHDS